MKSDRTSGRIRMGRSSRERIPRRASSLRALSISSRVARRNSSAPPRNCSLCTSTGPSAGHEIKQGARRLNGNSGPSRRNSSRNRSKTANQASEGTLQAIKPVERLHQYRAQEVWSPTDGLTCGLQCTITRTRCNAIRTLLQLNSDNSTVVAPGSAILPCKIAV